MFKLNKVERLVAKGKEDGLINLTHDHNKEVRLAAIKGLGKVGQGDSCNVLLTMMLDDDADIRRACAEALGAMGEPRARALMMHHLEVEKDESVIAAIHEAVKHLHDNE